MKYITKFFHTMYFHDTARVLGRWSLVHSEKQISYKVDMSNEDHCGVCGNYILEKRGPGVKEERVKQKEEVLDDEYYRYLVL